MKYNYDDIPNDRIFFLIEKWVHGERDRAIMKRRLIDCICFEPLAEEFDISERYVRKIVAKNEEIIYKHIDDKEPRAACAVYAPHPYRIHAVITTE